jgi:subtilisin family serine protease
MNLSRPKHLPNAAKKRVTATLIIGSLAGSLLGSVAPVALSSVSAAPSGEYIVTFNPSSDLNAKLGKEMRLGNSISDVFTSAAEGFVANLDAADVERLRRDGDLATIELNRPVSIADESVIEDDPAEVDSLDYEYMRPQPPRSLAAVPADGAVALSWVAPEDIAINPVTDYVVQYTARENFFSLAPWQWITYPDGTNTNLTAVVSGLTNGSRYVFRVRALSTGGDSRWSRRVQARPQQLVLNDAFAAATELVGDSGATVGSTLAATRELGEPIHGGYGGTASIWYQWTAPANGSITVATQGSTFDTLLGAYTGDALDSLVARAKNDDASGERVLWSRVTFTVVKDTKYSVAIDGWNGAKGDTNLSWVFTASLPPTLPSAPRDVVAQPMNASLGVTWAAPLSDGNSPITLYTATASPNGATCASAQNSCVIPGLTNGTPYTVTVVATNEVGDSPASAASEPVAPALPTTDPVTAASWGLDRVDQRALPLNNTIVRTKTGVGVTAYIIDTGVMPTHNEFTGRVIAGFSSINDGYGSNDCHGHGTHVAGTVAGTTYGVAPQATIVPIRVLSCYGSGSDAGVIAGIDWMVAHHVAGTPAVANMSLGGGYSAALNSAVARAVADGIAMVVAAGNENSDACATSPASEPTALTVGATDITDARAYYSNVGTCLDLFAPGSSITSAGISSPTSSRTMSGTSMAAPHVAGAAALVLEASPNMSPASVASSMLGNATANVVRDPAGSANLLLFTGEPTPPPVPTTTAPETTVPVTTVPETTVPETTVPETTVPVTTVPETTVPETTVAPQSGQVSTLASATSQAVAPQVSVVRATADRVTLRIVAKNGKVDIYRNGKYVLTTTKKLVTLKVKSLASSRFTVRASRAR